MNIGGLLLDITDGECHTLPEGLGDIVPDLNGVALAETANVDDVDKVAVFVGLGK